jgi:hypothetical protein
MLTLTRQVHVESFLGLAEIGVSKKREELLAVLKLAAEGGGLVRAEDVNTTLMDHPPESPQGLRVLMLIESYGLAERTGNEWTDPYRITDAGKENLEKGEVMIPEAGLYQLFATTDPVFVEPLLKIERATNESRETDARFRRRDAPKEESRRSLERPGYLDRYAKGYLCKQTADSNKLVQLNSISEKLATSSKHLDVRVTLELEPGSPPRMKVRVRDRAPDAEEVYSETKFDMEYNDVLKAITRDQGKLEIVGNEPTLMVGWDKVSPFEAERFRKQIKVEGLKLGEFGNFDGVSLVLPIMPATQQDVIGWASYLLRRGVSGYVDQQGYEKIREEVAAKFAGKYDVSWLVSHIAGFGDMLAQTVEQKRDGMELELYWYLHAPKDLSAG